MTAQIFRNVAKGLRAEAMSFRDFYPLAWKQLEPATPFVDNWHYGLIAEHLEAVVLGQIRRLIINTPPRTWKSGQIEVAFGCWVWTQRPWTKFIFGAYAADLALTHSVHRRNLMRSPFYQAKWGNVFEFADDQDRKGQYENSSLGSMVATSMGGTITGFGANIIVIGDWINPKLGESAAHRKAAHTSYDVSVRTRLNDPQRDAIVIAEQRTHAEDLTGHVLQQEDWLRLDVPAMFRARRVYSFPLSTDAAGKPAEKVCEPGEVLQPHRFPLSVLEATRRAGGTRTFNAQQLQTPDDVTGAIVNKLWWRFYDDDPREVAAKARFVGFSWDMAFVRSDTSSYVVGLACALRGGFKDVLDESRDQRNYPETKREVRRFSRDWPMGAYKWVENKANGPAIVDDLSTGTEHDPAIPGVISVPPELGDKVARMVRASAQIESGHVRLPNPYLRDPAGFRPDRYDEDWVRAKRINPRFQWVVDFIEELARFPKEPNDRGDALSQLVVMLDKLPADIAAGQEGAFDREENPNFLEAMDRAILNLEPFPGRGVPAAVNESAEPGIFDLGGIFG